MRYLLFLLLLASCGPQRLIVRQETANEILVKVAGRDKWITISKATPYQDYYPYNYGRRLVPGDLIVFDHKKNRVQKVAVAPMCGCNLYDWLYLNYPDSAGGFKCNCK